jgi:hypothetical protein
LARSVLSPIAMKKLLLALGPGLLALCLASPALARTDAELDSVDDDDGDGRRDIELLWLKPTAGYRAIDMTTFEADENLTGELVPARLTGPTFGLGGGLRVLFISAGLNGGVALFPDHANDSVEDTQLWMLDGNVNLHLLTGYQIEPYLQVGAGYQAFGGLGAYDIYGWNAHAGVGLDFFLSDDVSLGGLLSGELMYMTRPGRNPAAVASADPNVTVEERVLEVDGSSLGSGYSLVVGPGLHF